MGPSCSQQPFARGICIRRWSLLSLELPESIAFGQYPHSTHRWVVFLHSSSSCFQQLNNPSSSDWVSRLFFFKVSRKLLQVLASLNTPRSKWCWQCCVDVLFMCLSDFFFSLFALWFAEAGTPTCVDFVRNEPGQVVVGYTSAQAVLFDYETSKAVCLFDSLKAGRFLVTAHLIENCSLEMNDFVNLISKSLYHFGSPSSVATPL